MLFWAKSRASHVHVMMKNKNLTILRSILGLRELLGIAKTMNSALVEREKKEIATQTESDTEKN